MRREFVTRVVFVSSFKTGSGFWMNGQENCVAKTKNTNSLSLSLGHAAKLLKEDPGLAENHIREILRVYPDEPNALNLLGAAQRLTGQPELSLKTLKQVVSKHPDFGIGHLELGLTLQALGKTSQAQTTLERATELVPEVPDGWKALGDVRTVNGDEEGSQEAYQNQLLRVAGHGELVEAAKLLFAGKLGKAESICREFLYRHPTNVSAIRLLADIGIKLGPG